MPRSALYRPSQDYLLAISATTLNTLWLEEPIFP